MMALGVFAGLETAAAQTQDPNGGLFPGVPVDVVLDVAPSGGPSNLNGVFEPGETVLVQPAYANGNIVDLGSTTTAENFIGPPGATYTIVDSSAFYLIPAGSVARCSDCLVLSIDNPTPRPALHWDASFFENAIWTLPTTWSIHVGASFGDVPTSDPFYLYVEEVFHNEVTAGCGGNSYCPTRAVTRSQMAVFLLKAEHTAAYVPPACTGIFADVPCPGPYADWIERLSGEGITAGCGGTNFCPDAPVTREQAALFLLKAKNGSSHVPPPCTGTFADVPCPSPFADWIEELAADGITGGCGGANYCPVSPNSRGQLAAFLVKTFGLSFPTKPALTP
jgi:hypothetical protein